MLILSSDKIELCMLNIRLQCYHSRTFKSRRSMIERCFGILKNSYSSVGVRRFRNRRWIGPVVCNLTAALYNRRKILFHLIRLRTGLMYQNWTWKWSFKICQIFAKNLEINLLKIWQTFHQDLSKLGLRFRKHLTILKHLTCAISRDAFVPWKVFRVWFVHYSVIWPWIHK